MRKRNIQKTFLCIKLLLCNNNNKTNVEIEINAQKCKAKNITEVGQLGHVEAFLCFDTVFFSSYK
jgi:hypothetical protein